jgi:hypothetical protein
MSEDAKEDRPEGRLGRWSRRKGQERAGETPADEPETPEKPKKRGTAAPVAGRRFVPVMPPLAEPEEGEIEMEAAPPEALALKTQLEAEQAAMEEEEAEEERELTPEQEEAVKDLPPVESLTKDSDFTPFFAQNVPDFLKRQAYKVLWRSNPFFKFRDGLDDYDEDFSLAKLVGKIVSETEGAPKPGQARANDETAKTAASEKGVDAEGEDDDIGDGEDDGEEVVANAESGVENGAETADSDIPKDESDTPKETRKSDVRPPDNAV